MGLQVVFGDTGPKDWNEHPKENEFRPFPKGPKDPIIRYSGLG